MGFKKNAKNQLCIAYIITTFLSNNLINKFKQVNTLKIFYSSVSKIGDKGIGFFPPKFISLSLME